MPGTAPDRPKPPAPESGTDDAEPQAEAAADESGAGDAERPAEAAGDTTGAEAEAPDSEQRAERQRRRSPRHGSPRTAGLRPRTGRDAASVPSAGSNHHAHARITRRIDRPPSGHARIPQAAATAGGSRHRLPHARESPVAKRGPTFRARADHSQARIRPPAGAPPPRTRESPHSTSSASATALPAPLLPLPLPPAPAAAHSRPPGGSPRAARRPVPHVQPTRTALEDAQPPRGLPRMFHATAETTADLFSPTTHTPADTRPRPRAAARLEHGPAPVQGRRAATAHLRGRPEESTAGCCATR